MKYKHLKHANKREKNRPCLCFINLYIVYNVSYIYIYFNYIVYRFQAVAYIAKFHIPNSIGGPVHLDCRADSLCLHNKLTLRICFAVDQVWKSYKFTTFASVIIPSVGITTYICKSVSRLESHKAKGYRL